MTGDLQKAKSKMEDVNSILNGNGLNSLIKRQKLLDWIRKHDSSICCLQNANFGFNNTNRLKIKRMEKDIPCKH